MLACTAELKKLGLLIRSAPNKKTTFEKCEEDIECQNNQYCWYPSKSFRELEVPSKVCLEQYSLDVGETFGWEA